METSKRFFDSTGGPTADGIDQGEPQAWYYLGMRCESRLQLLVTFVGWQVTLVAPLVLLVYFGLHLLGVPAFHFLYVGVCQ